LAYTALGPSLRQEWPAQIHSLDPDLVWTLLPCREED
jgi:hypothetical protein